MSGVSVELLLKLLLMLPVLLSHGVQNRISYDFNFVRWPLHCLISPLMHDRKAEHTAYVEVTLG